jgi:predicted metal-dependent phosphoesterase TrpH
MRCGTLQLKIDLHVHTHYSHDSVITPQDLIFYSKKRGLDGVAVTDHDRLDSALKLAKETSLFIIPGMEIESANGHIVALNLKEAIPKGLSVDETVDRIHEAGGIAVASHPVTFFKGSLGKHVSSKFDAVEVINSSAFPFNRSVKHGELLASHFRKARVAGSDAHYGPEIGCAYTVVDAEPDVTAVINAIKKGTCQPFGSAFPLTMRMKGFLARLNRR